MSQVPRSVLAHFLEQILQKHYDDGFELGSLDLSADPPEEKLTIFLVLHNRKDHKRDT